MRIRTTKTIHGRCRHVLVLQRHRQSITQPRVSPDGNSSCSACILTAVAYLQPGSDLYIMIFRRKSMSTRREQRMVGVVALMVIEQPLACIYKQEERRHHGKNLPGPYRRQRQAASRSSYAERPRFYDSFIKCIMSRIRRCPLYRAAACAGVGDTLVQASRRRRSGNHRSYPRCRRNRSNSPRRSDNTFFSTKNIWFSSSGASGKYSCCRLIGMANLLKRITMGV